MSSLRSSLPADIARLDVEQFDTANVKVLEAALVATRAPYHQLDALASDLKKRLGALPGVGQVQIEGLPSQEVTVSIDWDRMVALRLSPTELIAAIGADSQNVPAGSVDVGARRFNVKTSGDYGSIEELESTAVRTAPDGSVHVRDIAVVRLGDGEPNVISRFNGQRAVLIDTAIRDGTNVLDVRPLLGKELDAFRKSLPPGVELEIGFDQADNVKQRLAGFSRDFAIAIALVLLTLLPLGVRASSIVMVSIPLSLAIGLSILHLLGFSLNQVSIVGFVIALGLLVDDSIVVVENIARHIRGGLSPKEAAVIATRQITVSVLGCTLTLVLAFLPILVLTGAAGTYMRSLPLAVIASVSASLLVAMTIVPFLASRWLRPEAREGNRFFRGLTATIELVFRPILSRALRHPRTTVLIALALVVGSAALVPRIGFGLFPQAGLRQFLVQIEMADGTNLAETDRAALFVEATLKHFPEVHMTATVVGKGHPQVYYNVIPQNEKAAVADVLVELERLEPERMAALTERIRSAIANYPGARIELHEFHNGPLVDAPLALRLLCNDSDHLRAAASKVADVLRSTPGTRDVRNPGADRRFDMRLHIDRERAAVLGVSVPDVDRAARLAIGGLIAGEYREKGAAEARPIRIVQKRQGQDARAGRPSLSVLDHAYVTNSNGAAVPLNQVTTMSLEPSATTIRHTDRARSLTVTAQIDNGHNTHAVTLAALARIDRLTLPSDVRLVVAGEVESREDSFSGMGTAIIIAAFGLLAVLILEFRTFRGTAIVASVMPLGALGGLFAVYLAGYALSFTATIGFIALMGIEIKNSILLVDYTNHLRQAGLTLDDAIQKAGEVRFVPVLFTTLTALGGLIPLVLERSALYSPLAVVLVGGLVSSTLLARIVTPVLYRLLPPPIEGQLEEHVADRSGLVEVRT
jgi:multidrug efflux pump subunit AcrB